MSESIQISDEQLNAFIDGQLDNNERVLVLTAIKNDKEIEKKFNQFIQVKELVTIAYNTVPEPPKNIRHSNARSSASWKFAAAACLVLSVGVVVGLTISNNDRHETSDSFFTVSEMNAATLSNAKVLIHISSMDKDKIEAALKKAEILLSEHKKQKKILELEIIANAEGLGILRESSNYSAKISSLSSDYSNVSFLACGIARENARLKEGHEIKLLPEAAQVPAALEQILKRIKHGWLYVKA